MLCITLGCVHEQSAWQDVAFQPDHSDDDEFDNNDMWWLIHDICETFAAYGDVVFGVTALADKPWHLDDRFDLNLIFEQLLSFLSCMDQHDRAKCYLNLWEQGMSRQLVFEESAGLITIERINGSEWEPQWNQETLTRQECEAQFSAFIKPFVFLTKERCPAIYSTSAFDIWLSMPSIARRVKPD